MSYLIILLALVIVIILALVVWVAYSVTVAYQQTLVTTSRFTDTYRHVPKLHGLKKAQLDSIKVTVTGRIKKSGPSGPIIALGEEIKKIVQEQIITPYSGCLIMYEANTFTVDEHVLKRYSVTKEPTLENLSIIFFNKLAPLMPKLGCQLVSVNLVSEDLEVSHSRYKINSFHM
jgi:6-pyruvoyl-tetrahydropterin synthase